MKARPKQAATGTAGKLFALRKELKLTANQMAKSLEIQESSYAKYERGETIPGFYTLQLIVEKYGLSIDWLIYDRPPKYVEDRNRTAALEKEVQQLKTNMENGQKDFENRVKELETALEEKNKKIETLERQLKEAKEALPGVYDKTGIPELLDMVEKNPVFYYKLMLYVEDFKQQEKGKQVKSKN